MKNNSAEENFAKIEDLIKKAFPEPVEKMEAWTEVDRIINVKFVHTALDKLDDQYREEFVELFVNSPNDEEKIFGYLEEKAGKDVRKEMTTILSDISKELIEVIGLGQETSSETKSEGKPPIK